MERHRRTDIPETTHESRDLRFRLKSSPSSLDQVDGVTQAHIEAVLAGQAKANAALIAALYPEDPDDADRSS